MSTTSFDLISSPDSVIEISVDDRSIEIIEGDELTILNTSEQGQGPPGPPGPVSEYVVQNVLHVKSNGSDSASGGSWGTALRTIEKALQIATERGTPTLIEWAPESVVYTKGHLDMPDNCVIKATHRTVFLRPEPGYEERNVIRMGSGCFVEGIMFEGWRVDSLTNPTEGFAISFRPGAVISRVPYAHKIAVRALPNWSLVAPPLDAPNANPDVPRSGGVVLADGLVCSQYSIFPNIMTWGATPVLPNGIGYCAKNGALINAVNAVSLWAHKHFMALSGGQVILSSCSTQFGDYTLIADGARNIISTSRSNAPKLTLDNTATGIANKATLAYIDPALVYNQNASNEMWDWNALSNEMLQALEYAGYTSKWNDTLKTKTISDSKLLFQCLYWTLKSGNEQPMLDFGKGMFDVLAKPVYISSLKLSVPILKSISTDATIKSLVSDIGTNTEAIINKMWTDLVARQYVTTWTSADEYYTRRDAGTLLTAISLSLKYGSDFHVNNFLKGLYNADGSLVIEYQKLPATIFAWVSMKNSILALSSIVNNETNKALISSIFDAIIANVSITKSSSINVNQNIANIITTYKSDIIQDMWTDLAEKKYVEKYLNAEDDEYYTRRDAGNLLDSLAQSFSQGSEQPLLDFTYGLFSFAGKSVISDSKLPATIYSFDLIRDEISKIGINSAANTIVRNLLNALKNNIEVKKVSSGFITNSSIASIITTNKVNIVNDMWASLITNPTYYNSSALTSSDETFTKRDAGLFLSALAECFTSGSDKSLIDFANKLKISFDTYVISPNKMPATLESFSIMGNYINSQLISILSSTNADYVNNLIANLKSNLTVSKGHVPSNLDEQTVQVMEAAAAFIKSSQSTIIDNMWTRLRIDPIYYNDNALTEDDQELTKRDAATLLTALQDCLTSRSETPMLHFTSRLYEPSRAPVISDSKISSTIYSFTAIKKSILTKANIAPSSIPGMDLEKIIVNLIDNVTFHSNKYAFIFCWEYISDYLTTATNLSSTPQFKLAVKAHIDHLINTINNPRSIRDPSRITAIGHTWTAVMSGVALTKVPPASNNARIQDSIIESNDGTVIASGQDDQGNALFVGGLEINADTGELGGPPFDQAVRRVATRTAISRSF